eukprot:TRINITY_DN23070_c0_g1_i1.p1 TRINITY_DN23070_c0_g1~~TRINITY_DN23070_c0_g1_i1.p1  ORF type:complete len:343 (+),score=52.24 TRINITY_DN23070_c0_g1_i1:61-1029(+)
MANLASTTAASSNGAAGVGAVGGQRKKTMHERVVEAMNKIMLPERTSKKEPSLQEMQRETELKEIISITSGLLLDPSKIMACKGAIASKRVGASAIAQESFPPSVHSFARVSDPWLEQYFIDRVPTFQASELSKLNETIPKFTSKFKVFAAGLKDGMLIDEKLRRYPIMIRLIAYRTEAFGNRAEPWFQQALRPGDQGELVVKGFDKVGCFSFAETGSDGYVKKIRWNFDGGKEVVCGPDVRILASLEIKNNYDDMGAHVMTRMGPCKLYTLFGEESQKKVEALMANDSCTVKAAELNDDRTVREVTVSAEVKSQHKRKRRA